MNNTYLISAIKKSLISLILSFIIFAPITGFVLDEYNVVINIYPAIILSSIVFIFCFLYLYINSYFKKYYNQMLFYKQNKHR